MYSVRRNNWHGRVRRLGLNGAPEVVISRHDGCTGKHGRAEIVVAGEVHPGGAWRRGREVRKAKLFGNGMRDIDIRRLALLKAVLDCLDD